jgi:hypothetical protein
MQHKGKIVGAILAAILSIGLYAASLAVVSLAARAECLPFDIERALAKDAAIFAGTVLRITPEQPGARDDLVLFEVERVWKGPRDSQMILHNPSQFDNVMSSIDLQFVEGETYLVFAYEHEGNLRTNLCEGTIFLDAAGDYLAVLGDGMRPTNEVNLLDSLPPTSALAAGQGAAAMPRSTTPEPSSSTTTVIRPLTATVPLLLAGIVILVVRYIFARKRR